MTTMTSLVEEVVARTKMSPERAHLKIAEAAARAGVGDAAALSEDQARRVKGDVVVLFRQGMLADDELAALGSKGAELASALELVARLRDERDAAIRDALDAGARVNDVASRADVHRNRVYQIMAEGRHRSA